MSLGGTLNASQAFSSSAKQPSKAQQNFFIKIDHLSSQLKEVSIALQDLQQEAANIFEQKTNVEKYLDKKSQENRLRLMGQLQNFEHEVKLKIEQARKETMKIDEKIQHMKQSQLYTLQLILSVQRRVQELQTQLGVDQSQ